MRMILIPLWLFFSNLVLGTQTATAEDPFIAQIEPMHVGGKLVSPQISEPEKPLSLQASQERTTPLLDMPQPNQQKQKDARDEDKVYETRAWWRDVDEPPRPWWHALRSGKFLGAVALLGGLTAIQLIKRDSCVQSRKPVCNLFFGKNRTAAYAVNIPLSGAIVLASARLKERGKPTGSAFVMVGGLVYETIAAYNANPHVLNCQAGRIPQCQ
jgi:hypothetical protein